MCSESTIQMLKCAFPKGIADEDFLPLLYVLKPYFSVRSLAGCIVDFLDSDYQLIIGKFDWPPDHRNFSPEEIELLTLMFVYQVTSAQYNAESELVNNIQTRLAECGFAEWAESEY